MKKRLISIMIILSMAASLVSLGGCQSANSSTGTPIQETGSSESESAFSASDTASLAQDEASTDSAPLPKVQLNNTYTTRFTEVNLVEYPAFVFDYPDGWTVVEEKVDGSGERVTLKNDRGVSVSYWKFGVMRELTGPIRYMKTLDVSKVADSPFVPSYVQATDHSALGKFMVAKLKTASETDMFGDGETTEVDGEVRYAVLPESEVGELVETIIVGLPTLSFWYSSHLSIVAEAPDGNFTADEEQAVIAILSSFRHQGDSPDALAGTLPQSPASPSQTPSGHTAASIEELWTMLEGTWKLEEYIFAGKPTEYAQHNVEFIYADKKPCMRTAFESKGSFRADQPFYDIISVDAAHYDVYIYKRGRFGGEGANWSSTTRLVWWSFDLTNIDNGEIVLTYQITWDDGVIDDDNVFKYKRL